MKFGKIALVVVASAVVGGLLLAERKAPLRDQKKPALPRTVRNAVMGAGCAVIVAAVEEPLTQSIAQKNEDYKRGLAQKLPKPLREIAGIIAMDYGFYWWHVATHRVPFLWRFHRVHHIDPDMDTSTAVRFHPADMFVSLPWRLVQVRLSGVGPRGLHWWRSVFNFSILFHHSNLKLPGRLDDLLAVLVTTPKMHGIHHSVVAEEADSNFTSGLSLWDRLHGTFRDDVRPDTITIGVNDSRQQDIELRYALTAPFIEQPENTMKVNHRNER